MKQSWFLKERERATNIDYETEIITTDPANIKRKRKDYKKFRYM